LDLGPKEFLQIKFQVWAKNKKIIRNGESHLDEKLQNQTSKQILEWSDRILQSILICLNKVNEWMNVKEMIDRLRKG
jgi:hypothetical protein